MSLTERVLKAKQAAARAYNARKGSLEGFEQFWRECGESETLLHLDGSDGEGDQTENKDPTDYAPRPREINSLSDFRSDAERLSYIKKHGIDGYQELAARKREGIR